MPSTQQTDTAKRSDEGYLLLGLVVAIFLILLALAVAAPRMAKELERDREVESTHRAQQYVRAIQVYYRRTGTYPASIDVLLSSNNIKFLRQQYKDPLTGDDYRLIHLGEAQTQVKGFFGEPLQGTAQGNLGALQGSASGIGTGIGGAGGGAFGPVTGAAGTPGATGAPGSTPSVGAGFSAAPGGNAGGFGSQIATSPQGSRGAIVGVGSNGKGDGLVEWNGTAEISQWEFLYDPRVELLKAKVNILGGAPAAGGALGQGVGSAPAGSVGTPAGGGRGVGAPGNIPGRTGALTQ